MDFHALPRRDLQALCKRNGVRANMTNVAMADALSALPAVDGIEEYVKEAIAEPMPAAKPVVKAVVEEEEQGNPLPRGRRVTSKLPEPITQDDREKDEGDLKRDENEENAPALGVGRRGASRRAARVEPVVAPATRRRAAASKTKAGDVAAEAVPAPTTRPRSQRKVALVAEENVPRVRRTTRRAATRNTGVQHEEEGGGTQGVVYDVETTVPATVSDEGRDDPDDAEEAAMNHLNEEQNEVVEELSQEDEGAVMDTPTPVEEVPPAAEDCAANLSVQERQVDGQWCEDSPIVMDLVEQEGGGPFRDGIGSGEGPLDVEFHHSSEETEIVPLNEAPPATLTPGEATEEVGITGDAGHATEENEAATFGEVLQSAAKASEAGTVDGFISEEKEDADVAVEGEVATHMGPQNSATMDGDVEEVITVDDVSQVTATDDEGAGKERALTGDLPPVADTTTSPLFAGMLDDATKSLSMDSITVEPTVPTVSKVDDLPLSEADDVPLCNGGVEKNVTEPVALEQEKEVMKGNNSEALGNLSLRKLRIKLKETVAVEQEKGVKGGKKSMALDKLSLRKLRVKLKESLIAHKSREPNRVALARLDENVC